MSEIADKSPKPLGSTGLGDSMKRFAWWLLLTQNVPKKGIADNGRSELAQHIRKRRQEAFRKPGSLSRKTGT